eukprot:gene4057-2907_t
MLIILINVIMVDIIIIIIIIIITSSRGLGISSGHVTPVKTFALAQKQDYLRLASFILFVSYHFSRYSMSVTVEEVEGDQLIPIDPSKWEVIGTNLCNSNVVTDVTPMQVVDTSGQRIALHVYKHEHRLMVSTPTGGYVTWDALRNFYQSMVFENANIHAICLSAVEQLAEARGREQARNAYDALHQQHPETPIGHEYETAQLRSQLHMQSTVMQREAEYTTKASPFENTELLAQKQELLAQKQLRHKAEDHLKDALQRQLEANTASVALGLQHTDDTVRGALSSIGVLTSKFNELSTAFNRISDFEDILKRTAAAVTSTDGLNTNMAEVIAPLLSENAKFRDELAKFQTPLASVKATLESDGSRQRKTNFLLSADIASLKTFASQVTALSAAFDSLRAETKRPHMESPRSVRLETPPKTRHHRRSSSVSSAADDTKAFNAADITTWEPAFSGLNALEADDLPRRMFFHGAEPYFSCRETSNSLRDWIKAANASPTLWAHASTVQSYLFDATKDELLAAKRKHEKEKKRSETSTNKPAAQDPLGIKNQKTPTGPQLRKEPPETILSRRHMLDSATRQGVPSAGKNDPRRFAQRMRFHGHSIARRATASRLARTGDGFRPPPSSKLMYHRSLSALYKRACHAGVIALASNLLTTGWVVPFTVLEEKGNTIRRRFIVSLERMLDPYEPTAPLEHVSSYLSAVSHRLHRPRFIFQVALPKGSGNFPFPSRDGILYELTRRLGYTASPEIMQILTVLWGFHQPASLVLEYFGIRKEAHVTIGDCDICTTRMFHWVSPNHSRSPWAPSRCHILQSLRCVPFRWKILNVLLPAVYMPPQFWASLFFSALIPEPTPPFPSFCSPTSPGGGLAPGPIIGGPIEKPARRARGSRELDSGGLFPYPPRLALAKAQHSPMQTACLMVTFRFARKGAREESRINKNDWIAIWLRCLNISRCKSYGTIRVANILVIELRQTENTHHCIRKCVLYVVVSVKKSDD